MGRPLNQPHIERSRYNMKQYQIKLLNDIKDNKNTYTWADIQDISQALFMIEEGIDLLSVLKSKEYNDFLAEAEKIYYKEEVK